MTFCIGAYSYWRFLLIKNKIEFAMSDIDNKELLRLEK